MASWADYSRASRSRINEYDRKRKKYPPKTGLTMPDLEDLQIGGSRMFQLAVLSIDIRGFTKIAMAYNNKGVESLARIQALYLAEMSNIIKEYDGVTEKYTGDGVMGLFGTESDTNAINDVSNAIKAALTVKLVLKNSLNPYLKESGLTEIQLGMGIDYGTVMMERVGLRGENQFSLAGPTVSLASKMQAQAEPGQIIIGEDVKKRVQGNDLKFVKPHKINWDFTYPLYLYDATWKE